MLIGKRSIFLLFIGFLIGGCGSTGNEVYLEKPEEAWWASKQFQALEDNIYGVPLSKINSDWKLISILNFKYFISHLSKAQYKDIQNSLLLPNIDVNLDGLPGVETFFVGVFESYSGETGKFIAIKKEGSDIIEYFTHSGIAGYSSIYLEKDKLRWYKCMQCSDFDELLWNGEKYILQ